MLTQVEADGILVMAKTFRSSRTISLHVGARSAHDLDPVDRLDLPQNLLLDVHRASIRLTKLKLQHRGAGIIVLARLDIDGPGHTNPDGVDISGTHLHLFREGFEDKWAEEIDKTEWTDLTDMVTTVQDFCGRFHISNVPPISLPMQPILP